MFRKQSRKVFLVVMVLILTTIVSACSPVPEAENKVIGTEITEEITMENVATTEETPETSVIEISSEVELRILDLTDFRYGAYSVDAEYLEYGSVVEYCQYTPELRVTFYLIDSQDMLVNWEYEDNNLLPPQFRALKLALGNREDYQGSYTVEASVSNNEIVSVNKILDTTGSLVWDTSMNVPPRDINDLEQAYLDAMFTLYGRESNKYLDTHFCEDAVYTYRYSHMEDEARIFAMEEYLQVNTDVVLGYLAYTHGDFPKTRIVDNLNNIINPFIGDPIIGGWPEVFYQLDKNNGTLISIQVLEEIDGVSKNRQWRTVITFDTEYFAFFRAATNIDLYPRIPDHASSNRNLIGYSEHLSNEELLKYFSIWVEEQKANR